MNIKNNFIEQPLKKNFLAIERKYSNYKNSQVVILPIPYEATTSYGKGTSKGPDAIIKASQYVEFFDEETKRELCFTNGICTLSEIKFNGKKGKAAIDLIYKNIADLLNDNKFLVCLGGEHSVSYPIIKAFKDKYNDFSVLHFDAHSDLRYSYEGTIYSHASFANRLIEFTKDIVQVGIRAQCKEENDLIRDLKLNTYFAHEIKRRKFDRKLIKEIISKLKKNVYITFDVDFLDPSIMPSTGTPEPDGFSYRETLDFFGELSKLRTIIGMDFVELAPVKNNPFPDFLTAKLIYKALNLFAK